MNHILVVHALYTVIVAETGEICNSFYNFFVDNAVLDPYFGYISPNFSIFPQCGGFSARGGSSPDDPPPLSDGFPFFYGG